MKDLIQNFVSKGISEMNDFCIKDCPLGVEKSKEFLDKNESAYDAAMGMCFFVEECRKTCPYKENTQLLD